MPPHPPFEKLAGRRPAECPSLRNAANAGLIRKAFSASFIFRPGPIQITERPIKAGCTYKILFLPFGRFRNIRLWFGVFLIERGRGSILY